MFSSPIIVPFALTILAGLTTVLGSFVFFLIRKREKNQLSFFLGFSAGAMVYISFIELLPSAIKNIGFLQANLAFFGGIALIALIDIIIPHHYLGEHAGLDEKRNKLFGIGIMTALGIAIHNFPEGIAVFLSSLSNIKTGLLLAFAIAIHNIPEGISIAVPVFAATNSKRKAVLFSFLSGITEPLGAILAYVLLRPFLSNNLLYGTFALAAGIMIYISFDELLPYCFKESRGHVPILGMVMGMLLIFFSLNFI